MFHTLLTFWPDFYYFMGIFSTQKMFMCTLLGGERGSQKVYGLYTHKNADIYGWPLNIFPNATFLGISVLYGTGPHPGYYTICNFCFCICFYSCCFFISSILDFANNIMPASILFSLVMHCALFPVSHSLCNLGRCLPCTVCLQFLFIFFLEILYILFYFYL